MPCSGMGPCSCVLASIASETLDTAEPLLEVDIFLMSGITRQRRKIHLVAAVCPSR